MLARLLRRVDGRHRAWRYRARIDPAEIRWLRAVLRPGDRVVDAGAYKGGYTYWMRHAVGLTGMVVACEPQPELARHLRSMVDAFGWRNVPVEEVALGAEPGETTLHVPGPRPSQRGSLVVERAGARPVDVTVETLDALLARRREDRPLRLLKADVEGAELDLFLGARETLERDRPLLLFECEARFLPGRSVRPVFDHLESIGYSGAFFWKRRLRALSEFRADEHQVEGTKPYANNFVFLPT